MIFLAAAGLVVPLMHRLRISPVLGFLVVGLAIGPHGLGQLALEWPWLQWLVIDDPEQVRGLAELGVVFLLFMIGLELSFRRLIQMRRLVFGLGGAQVLASAVVIGTAAFAFGNDAPASIILGACLALSSTAIVMELLVKARRLGSPTGRVSFGVLLFQDLAVVPVLFLVGVFGANTEGAAGFALLSALGKAALAIGVIYFLGRAVIRPLFNVVSEARSRELFMAAVLLIIIATSIASAQAGLSPALGAFLAGLLLAESEFRHQIEVDVEPFKGLLLGLFFLSVGMSIDVAEILNEPVWIPLSVFGLYAIKSTIVFLLALTFRQPRSVALESAMLLGQGGEFAFVVIALAVSLALLPADTAQFMLIVASLTMLLTPVVSQFARAICAPIAESERKRGARTSPDPPEDMPEHVVVAGYGRVGQMLGSILSEQRIPHIGLDVDSKLISKFRKMGAAVYFGDASNPDILRRAGIDNAIALAVTMDSPGPAVQVVRAVRKEWPNLPILARARDSAHAKRLLDAGATDVVPETVEASLELAETVICAAGFSEESAHQLIAERRKAEKGLAVEKEEEDKEAKKQR